MSFGPSLDVFWGSRRCYGCLVFVYAEGPEVPLSAHGPGTSPIGSATTRDVKRPW